MNPTGKIILLWLFAAIPQAAVSQIAVTTVSSSFVAAPSGMTYTFGGEEYRFGNTSGTSNNIEQINSFVQSGITYTYNTVVTGHVKIRRVDNPYTTGNRTLVWMQGVANVGVDYALYPPYSDQMEEFFQTRTMNKGTDNLFCNYETGSNMNNIERVDWILPLGVRTSNANQAGFLILERGNNNQHDPFCIAAITALDASGNPSAYGNIVRPTMAQYGNLTSGSVSFVIMSKNPAETVLRRSGAPQTQPRGAIFFTFANLGIAVNQRVYGYSLFGSDLPVTATPANLVNYNNSTYFPTNTSSVAGGIDLIAVTGLFNSATTTVTLPVRYQNWRAETIKEKVLMDWTITEPEECRSVTIQRSPDGKDWRNLATLLPEMNSFTDEPPSGKVCYRLCFTDQQGALNYSTIKVLKIGNADLMVRKETKGLFIQVKKQQSSNSIIQVFGINGQILYQHRRVLKKGYNHLDLACALRPGMYVIKILDPYEVLTQQFVY